MMKTILKHWRAAVRIVASLLLFASAGMAFVWYYQMGPLRRTHDPDWVRQHSAERYWHEVRKSIQRWGWMHDDFGPAGDYGDKEFLAWALARIRPGDDISSCFVGHRHSAFAMITNQNIGKEAAAWLEWWESNQAKSQEEWIQDGFAKTGIQVSLPPTEADVIPLLELLGTETGVDSEYSFRFLKYNAFRWLRDSELDFEPLEFVFAHSADAAKPQIQAGLLEYRKHERNHPKRETAGLLYFGTVGDWYDDWSYIYLSAHPVFKQRMNALIVGLFVSATALILCTVTIPRRKETSA
ncbi:MAG: hypothetical protein EA424_24285 [Planctomycetaceae bacterium]|nr:MAG: hypothetical protein EA424_24285 [Planctomycetaceae bacterium]